MECHFLGQIRALDIVPTLNSVDPVLASLDIERTVTFYCSRLGFARGYVSSLAFGVSSHVTRFKSIFGRVPTRILRRTPAVVFT